MGNNGHDQVMLLVRAKRRGVEFLSREAKRCGITRAKLVRQILGDWIVEIKSQQDYARRKRVAS